MKSLHEQLKDGEDQIRNQIPLIIKDVSKKQQIGTIVDSDNCQSHNS